VKRGLWRSAKHADGDVAFEKCLGLLIYCAPDLGVESAESVFRARDFMRRVQKQFGIFCTKPKDLPTVKFDTGHEASLVSKDLWALAMAMLGPVVWPQAALLGFWSSNDNAGFRKIVFGAEQRLLESWEAMRHAPFLPRQHSARARWSDAPSGGAV
jgi:hypothetical protein